MLILEKKSYPVTSYLVTSYLVTPNGNIYMFIKLFKNADKVILWVVFFFSYTCAHLKPFV